MIEETSGGRHWKEKSWLFLSYEYQRNYTPTWGMGGTAEVR